MDGRAGPKLQGRKAAPRSRRHLLSDFLRRLRCRALRLDSLQRRRCTVLPADQLRFVLATLLGKRAREGIAQDGRGAVVDAGQGVVDLLFDAVGVGEELVYSADDFGLFFYGWAAQGVCCEFLCIDV